MKNLSLPKLKMTWGQVTTYQRSCKAGSLEARLDGSKNDWLHLLWRIDVLTMRCGRVNSAIFIMLWALQEAEIPISLWFYRAFWDFTLCLRFTSNPYKLNFKIRSKSLIMINQNKKRFLGFLP